MENKPKIGCVVMAAGNARRFGENKLAAQLRGRSLILRALEAVPAEKFDKVVVVTQYPEVMRLAGEFHFAAIHNPHPDYGISHTIELGLTALRDCDGVLFQVSDQPLLRRESVAELVDRWRTRPEKIVALGHGAEGAGADDHDDAHDNERQNTDGQIAAGLGQNGLGLEEHAGTDDGAHHQSDGYGQGIPFFHSNFLSHFPKSRTVCHSFNDPHV